MTDGSNVGWSRCSAAISTGGGSGSSRSSGRSGPGSVQSPRSRGPRVPRGGGGTGCGSGRLRAPAALRRGRGRARGLFAAVSLAERFPVPVEDIDSGGVTLGFVFSVSAIVLLGWEAGMIVAAGGPRSRNSRSAGRSSASPTTPRCSCSPRSPAASRSARSTATPSAPSSPGSPSARSSTTGSSASSCSAPWSRRARAGRSGLRRRERAPDERPVRADGLGGADARRALAALAVAVGRARRPAARDLALPALDVPRDAARCGSRSPIRSRASATTAASTSGSSAS